jgi:phosphotransferase system enzyme I (PtsI)
MEILRGIAVSPGVEISHAFLLDTEDVRIPRRTVVASEVPAEVASLQAAFDATRQNYVDLQANVARSLGEEASAVLGWPIRVLSDEKWKQRFIDRIEQKQLGATYAVSLTMREYKQKFLQLKDRYISERVQDVYDMERRLLQHLLGRRREHIANLEARVAVVAHDLTPSQTAELEKSGKVLAIATDLGGRTSHTAIVARSWGVPAVVGLGDITGRVNGGDTVIIDGTHGVVICDPDEATIEQYRQQRQRLVALGQSLRELRRLPAETVDGETVTLLANIEFPHEAAMSLDRGAAGIGLYRTEFLYLRGNSEPSEEEHYQAYRQVVEAMEGRPVVIRTLDLGADKYTQSRQAEPERNPFLGCRSIRLCLRNLDLFKPQLRAILRVSTLGDVRIMFPLITTLLELRQAKAVLRDAMEDLEEQGIAFRRDLPVGMMIETPAAADACRAFAREVDFISIGTNDLVQYMLAVDRANERIASLYSPGNPAVIRKVRDIIRTADRANISVSLCGEVAGDPMFTLLLLGLGLRRFSMTPPDVPEIKKMIRSVTIRHARWVARKVLSFESDREVVNYLRDEARKVLPEAL